MKSMKSASPDTVDCLMLAYIAVALCLVVSVGVINDAKSATIVLLTFAVSVPGLVQYLDKKFPYPKPRALTCGELIYALQKCDPNSPVCAYNVSCGENRPIAIVNRMPDGTIVLDSYKLTGSSDDHAR